jgi:hypothetical protein
MSATFSIKRDSDSITWNYCALNDFTKERAAIIMSIGAPSYQYNTWHVPGTAGNIVANLGNSGRTIIATVMYRGTYPQILKDYQGDLESMSGTSLTITDACGGVHTRCRLIDSREQTPPRGFSTAGYAFMTAILTFEEHGMTQGPQGSQGPQGL